MHGLLRIGESFLVLQTRGAKGPQPRDGEKKPRESVTFYPILQPLGLMLLTLASRVSADDAPATRFCERTAMIKNAARIVRQSSA